MARLKTVGGFKLLYVMATLQEFTSPLRQRIDPLISGVGPVEAAAGLAFALGRLRADNTSPDLIVAVGSSGSATLDHAGVYQANSVSYRDMDCSPLGFERGVTPFSSELAVFHLAPSIPGLPSASLATGASIVSGRDYAQVDADMVDMETYAYARVARLVGAPFVALRAISDGRAPLTEYADWAETLVEIGTALARAVDLCEAALANGHMILLPR